MAAIASTIGTARGNTHGSCRPLACTTVGSPVVVTVGWSRSSVATGLKATRNTISCPLEMPPWIPPLWFVAVEKSGSKTSLSCDPRNAQPAKPSPYSKPLAALMLSIAAPNCAWSLSNTGAPHPGGQPRTTHSITPPTVSPSARTSRIRRSISAATAASGQRTAFVSIISSGNS